jgi:inosine-uridine nucleoside N-ribohydrolase
MLAMLLAFAAKPEELEVLLLSVTYGNVDVQRYFVFKRPATVFVVNS